MGSLRRVGILSDAPYKRRCIVLNQRGYKDGEPSGMPHFARSRIFDLVFKKDNPKYRTRKNLAQVLYLPQEAVDAGTFAPELLMFNSVHHSAIY